MDALKSILETEKNLKNPLVKAKKPKKTPKNLKNPKKTQKTQKNPLGWVFLKNPGFFQPWKKLWYIWADTSTLEIQY